MVDEKIEVVKKVGVSSKGRGKELLGRYLEMFKLLEDLRKRRDRNVYKQDDSKGTEKDNW